MTAAGQRCEVDAYEIRTDDDSRGARELDRFVVRSDRSRPSAERDVRAPLAGHSRALCGADHLSAGNDHSEIVAERGQKLLNNRAVPSKPRPVCQ